LSEIRANTISDAAGTGPATLTGQSAAKAWLNFSMSGTATVRNSVNVSSITDAGVGLPTVNFTNAMAYSNYSVSGIGSLNARVQGRNIAYTSNRNTLQFLAKNTSSGTGAYDDDDANMTFHGDLA